MWPAIYDHPDLTYSVRLLSQFCKILRPTYVELVKHILQYISSTLNLGLTLNRKQTRQII